MTLVLCLDGNNGMMFNGRRQSSDRVVDKCIIDLSTGGRLLVDTYSTKRFPEALLIGHELNALKDDDVCFAENADIARICIDHADRVIIYRWDKIYPADVYFSAPLTKPTWRKVKTEDLTGYSHKQITKEVYVRE